MTVNRESSGGRAGAATPAWEEPDLSDVLPSSTSTDRRQSLEQQQQQRRSNRHSSSGNLNSGGGGGVDGGGGGSGSSAMMQSSSSLQASTASLGMAVALGATPNGHASMSSDSHDSGMLHYSRGAGGHNNHNGTAVGGSFGDGPAGVDGSSRSRTGSRNGGGGSGFHSRTGSGSFRGVDANGNGNGNNGHVHDITGVDPSSSIAAVDAAQTAETTLSRLNAAEERLRRFSESRSSSVGGGGSSRVEHSFRDDHPELLDAGSQRSLGSGGGGSGGSGNSRAGGRREYYSEDNNNSGGSMRRIAVGTYNDGGGGARGLAEEDDDVRSAFGDWRAGRRHVHHDNHRGAAGGGGFFGRAVRRSSDEFGNMGRAIRRSSNEFAHASHAGAVYLRKGSVGFVNYGGQAARRGSNEVMQVFQERNDRGEVVKWKKQRLYLLTAFVVTTIGLSVGLVIMDQQQRESQNGAPGGSFVGVAGGTNGNGGTTVGDSPGGLIPPPPERLPSICDPANLHGSSDMAAECADACQPASCCWSSDPSTSCFSSQEAMCGRYGDCGNLVDDMLDTDDGEDKGSYYADVKKARVRPSETIVPDPPERLPEYCAPTNDYGQPGGSSAEAVVAVADHDECLNYCQPASCCLERGPNLSCRANVHNAGSCKFYAVHCSNLPSSAAELGLSDYDGRIPSPPEGLEELCSREMVASDADVAEECDRLCSPGLCCVGMGLESDCLFTDEEDCRIYERSCAASVWPGEALLDESFGDYLDDGESSVPSPLAGICSDAQLQTDDGRAVCDDVCRAASCCWEVGLGNCAAFNDATCDDYALCPSFQATKTRAGGGSSSWASAAVPMQPLDNLCSISSILHPEGLGACKAACALGACCFESSQDGDNTGSNGKSCSDDPTCSLYQVCTQLPYDEWSARFVPSPLEYVCDPSKLSTDMGRSRCYDACQPGSCCWAEGYENCFEDEPGRCRGYEPCRANLPVPPTPPTLAELCDDPGFEDDRGKVACIEACQPAACCWRDADEGDSGSGAPGTDTDSAAGPCYDMNDFTCDEYSSHCGPVKSELHYGMGPDPVVSPVAKACSPSSLQTDAGIRLCREKCEPSWCCVAEDPLNCYDSNPVFCAKYAPICGPILTSDLLYEDDYDRMREGDLSPIDLVCSMKSVMTEAGRGNCMEMCSFAECCFVSDEGGEDNGARSCRDDDDTDGGYCDTMEACAVLGRVTPRGEQAQGDQSQRSGGDGEEEELVLVAGGKALAAPTRPTLPFAPADIEELCSSGGMGCYEACSAAECCGLSAHEGGCREGNEEACRSYGPCDALDN